MRTNKRSNIKKHKKTRRRRGGSKGSLLACSPLVKKSDKVAKDSCITKPALMRLRDEFNKDHPDNPIMAMRPILICLSYYARSN